MKYFFDWIQWSKAFQHNFIPFHNISLLFLFFHSSQYRDNVKKSWCYVFKYDTSFIISIFLWMSTLHLKCVSSFSFCVFLVYSVFPPFYTRIINQLRPCFSYEHIAVKLIHNMKLLFNNIGYDDYNNNIKRCLQSFRCFYNLQHIHDRSKQHTSQFPIIWRHTINVCLLLIKLLQFSRDTFINLPNVL